MKYMPLDQFTVSKIASMMGLLPKKEESKPLFVDIRAEAKKNAATLQSQGESTVKKFISGGIGTGGIFDSTPAPATYKDAFTQGIAARKQSIHKAITYDPKDPYGGVIGTLMGVSGGLENVGNKVAKSLFVKAVEPIKGFRQDVKGLTAFKPSKSGYGTFISTKNEAAGLGSDVGKKIYNVEATPNKVYIPNATEQWQLNNATSNNLKGLQRDIATNARKQGYDAVKFSPDYYSILDPSKIRIADLTFQGLPNLSTKLLERFKGMPEEITPQQFNEVLNKTKKEGLRQADEQLITSLAKPGANGKINLTQLAQQAETQLVPLTPTPVKSPIYAGSQGTPDYIGDGKYGEIVYQSPIKTSAQGQHFGAMIQDFPNYFSHVRYEDLADGKTRKILETQSDLMQKENFASEFRIGKHIGESKKEVLGNKQKLAPYNSNDPLAHLRTFREEVKRAAKDGKDTILIPSGETAMKIEGLVERNNWNLVTPNFNDFRKLEQSDLKIGAEVAEGSTPWIITDVLGDGKFKAVPKTLSGTAENFNKYIQSGDYDKVENFKETFNISGKVDTKHFVYKLNEEAIPREARKMGLEVEKVPNLNVPDEFNMTTRETVPGDWWRIKIPKERSKIPVEAYGLGGLPFLPSKDYETTQDNQQWEEKKPSIVDKLLGKREIRRRDLPQMRNIPVTEQVEQQFKDSIYSEVSDFHRPEEVKIMLNAAINQSHKTGRPILELLRDKNYIQGVTNDRYAATSTASGENKITQDFVNQTIDDILKNGLEDTTGGDNHFVHIESGPNTDKAVSLNEKEFAIYIKKKGRDRDRYAESLLTY